jgi:hypothetical protein
MATTKPRMSITLTPEARAALERLSVVSGIAASSYISGLVHDAIPVINATADALALAKKQPQRAAEIMNEQLVRVVGLAAQGKLELEEAVEKRKRMRRRPRKP